MSTADPTPSPAPASGAETPCTCGTPKGGTHDHSCARLIAKFNRAAPTAEGPRADDDEFFCRDCADEDGTCPATGLPCDPGAPAPSRPVEQAETPTFLDYPAAAQSIALNLADFCDESLPYPTMIADAARKAARRLAALTSEVARLTEALDEFFAAEADAEQQGHMVDWTRYHEALDKLRAARAGSPTTKTESA